MYVHMLIDKRCHWTGLVQQDYHWSRIGKKIFGNVFYIYNLVQYNQSSLNLHAQHSIQTGRRRRHHRQRDSIANVTTAPPPIAVNAQALDICKRGRNPFEGSRYIYFLSPARYSDWRQSNVVCLAAVFLWLGDAMQDDGKEVLTLYGMDARVMQCRSLTMAPSWIDIWCRGKTSLETTISTSNCNATRTSRIMWLCRCVQSTMSEAVLGLYWLVVRHTTNVQYIAISTCNAFVYSLGTKLGLHTSILGITSYMTMYMYSSILTHACINYRVLRVDY